MNSSGKKGEHKVKTAASFCGGGETKVESRRPRLVLAIWSWFWMKPTNCAPGQFFDGLP
jgi:hypothetical protein